MRTAAPAGTAAWIDERPCRICPARPARNIELSLCDKHWFRWYRHLELHGGSADFDDWLAEQQPFPGYGGCLVRVCPELANSPLGLCARHDSSYRSHGSPGGAKLPSQWANRYERRGLVCAGRLRRRGMRFAGGARRPPAVLRPVAGQPAWAAPAAAGRDPVGHVHLHAALSRAVGAAVGAGPGQPLPPARRCAR